MQKLAGFSCVSSCIRGSSSWQFSPQSRSLPPPPTPSPFPRPTPPLTQVPLTHTFA
ncbi:hypothetical protein COCMIDRAFT_84330 [Bipolaris oryzae ATCC 44560]|uniref:Uncharacterized protein n=1 Tax=Bipolaris oryzae ATCC 44560 TaxID=930090 RepID=W6ZCR0_COCMI|nr:uncharacterized protein COCMIDRAFT_84330 [Bipolaris oryzae ATCC 44560]EUC49607.1 hypothetical protein COCMIDRAFT_84330 [Bipolaris oryzae ATCC 44560]